MSGDLISFLISEENVRVISCQGDGNQFVVPSSLSRNFINSVFLPALSVHDFGVLVQKQM